MTKPTCRNYLLLIRSLNGIGTRREFSVKSHNPKYVKTFSVPTELSHLLQKRIDGFYQQTLSTNSLKKGEKGSLLGTKEFDQWHKELLEIATRFDNGAFVNDLKAGKKHIVVIQGINIGDFTHYEIPQDRIDLKKESVWRPLLPAQILSYFFNRLLDIEYVSSNFVFPTSQSRDMDHVFDSAKSLGFHNDNWESGNLGTTSFLGIIGKAGVQTVFITAEQITDYYEKNGEEGKKMLKFLSGSFGFGIEEHGYPRNVGEILQKDDKSNSYNIRFSSQGAERRDIVPNQSIVGDAKLLEQFIQDLQKIEPCLRMEIESGEIVIANEKHVLHARVVPEASPSKEIFSRMLFRLIGKDNTKNNNNTV